MRDPDRRIWHDVLAHLRRENPQHWREWLEDLEPLSCRDMVLELGVPARLLVHLPFLRQACTNPLRDAAQAVRGELMIVRFVPLDRARPAASAAGPASNGRREGETPAAGDRAPADARGDASLGTYYEDMIIDPDCTFETFVLGPDNELAHAAATAVADQPGEAYNPLFVHGGVGLGKTHLLHAVCQRVAVHRPDHRIYYISCEGFCSQFMAALQSNRMDEFRQRYREIDMLVVDDIHFLVARDHAQEEFFHTFNSLYQARKQIVLSSDASPQQIAGLEDRLESRFGSGLVARIDFPGFETRITILRVKARLRGVDLAEDVAAVLAKAATTSVRQLDGALTSLLARADLGRRPIDVDLAREVLRHADVPPGDGRPISVDHIVTEVCRTYRVKASELRGRRRPQSIARPRQVAMYLARQLTSESLNEIGRQIGGRDHSTVLHAVRQIEALRDQDPMLDRQIDELSRRLGHAAAN